MELSVVPYNNKSDDYGDIVEPTTNNKNRNKNKNKNNESIVRYRECMRNHAASLGGHASDGCGDFLASSAGDSLICAACGCHRNFHRREIVILWEDVNTNATTTTIMANVNASNNSNKRFRTKFSSEQKEKMFDFAESIGWRIQRHYDSAINQFCSDIGVRRNVLKVWMHNNKNALRRTQSLPHHLHPIPNNNVVD